MGIPLKMKTEVKRSGPTAVTRSLEKTDSPESSCMFIDTNEGVEYLIEAVSGLPVNPPSLYVDLEGVNLSRHGTISVIQLYALPHNRTYVIDVQKLKEKTFSQASSTGRTLKNILESHFIPKVFFDVRSDSDALYSHYGKKLAGVEDLQLMELATRKFSRELVHGLAKCIDLELSIPASEKAAWKLRKEKGRELFSPEQGGSYEIWNIRPLPAEIMQYCVQDVQILARLWERYNRDLNSRWAKTVKQEVERRIADSQSADFIEKGRLRTLAPLGWTQHSSVRNDR